MPRPAQPLIDRRTVIAKAIEVIDAEGLAACSLPRLGRELGVKAPSLYHHFDDRADIMAEVARSIVRETVVPRHRDPADWVEWLVAMCVNFRRAVLRHPNAAPILLEFVPSDVLSTRYDDAAAFMSKAGVPVDRQVLILAGLENLILGTALVQAMKPPAIRSKIFAHVDQRREPALATAVAANPWSTPEKLFAETVRTFLRGAAQS